jgi:hypothetical protein
MSNNDINLYPKNRTHRLDLKRCVVQSSGGELAEISYYERNNWVTIEYRCAKCGRRFTVKVET